MNEEMMDDEMEIKLLRGRCQELRLERNAVNLTIVTLCDMVLGEDAPDRSDEALLRGVRALINKANKHDYLVTKWGEELNRL